LSRLSVEERAALLSRITGGQGAYSAVGGLGTYDASGNRLHVDTRPGARQAWGPSYSADSLGRTPEWFRNSVNGWRGNMAPPPQQRAEPAFDPAFDDMFSGRPAAPRREAAVAHDPAFDAMFALPAAPAAPPERSVGMQAARVAGNFGAGFNTGVARTVGALPDLYDRGLRAAGVAPLFGREGQTFTERLQGGMNRLVGEPPAPENRLERAARGAGEGTADAAAVFLPAGMVARGTTAAAGAMPSVTNAASRALASQPVMQAASGAVGGAVGEATDNPLLGAAAGIALPFGVSGVNRVLSPVRPGALTPERQAMVNLLQREGIPLRPSAYSENPMLTRTESYFRDHPFTAGAEGRRDSMIQTAANQAVLRSAGIQAARATPDVLATGRARVGGDIGAIAGRNVAEFTAPRLNDLRNAAMDLRANGTDQAQRLIGNRIGEILDRIGPNGQMPGRAMRELDSSIGAQIRRTQDGDVRYRLENLQATMRRALATGARNAGNADDAALMAQRRREYANLVKIEKTMGGAGQAAAQGDIPIRQLRAQVASGRRREYALGRGNMDELVKALSVMVPDQTPNSGTFGRSLMASVPNALLSAASGGGATVAGSPVLGAVLGGLGLVAAPMARAAYYSPYMRPRAAMLPEVRRGAMAGIAATSARQAGRITDDREGR
jgi:hypothetical protein